MMETRHRRGCRSPDGRHAVGIHEGTPRMTMTLTEILVTHRHDILRAWVDAVRREAPETRGLSDSDLISNFPLLSDRLIQGPAGGKHPPVIPESREHAATRKRQGIGLATLLREYTLLQQAIKDFACERLGNRPGDSESR